MDEAPFWISINGRRRVVLSCATGAAEALAAGHLIGEGWIGSVADIEALAVVSGPAGSSGVEVAIAAASAERAESLRTHQTRHGCGLRHFLDCDDPLPRLAGSAAPVDLTTVFRELFAAAAAASPSGGVHAAGLSDGHVLQHVAVDVARHCAVDRTVGAGALAGVGGAMSGLVLTARVSAAMVVKAVRAGLPWIASRSVATPLAHELAAASGLVIRERAVRRDPSADGARTMAPEPGRTQPAPPPREAS